jgi:hypothetical protein
MQTKTIPPSYFGCHCRTSWSKLCLRLILGVTAERADQNNPSVILWVSLQNEVPHQQLTSSADVKCSCPHQNSPQRQTSKVPLTPLLLLLQDEHIELPPSKYLTPAAAPRPPINGGRGQGSPAGQQVRNMCRVGQNPMYGVILGMDATKSGLFSSGFGQKFRFTHLYRP